MQLRSSLVRWVVSACVAGLLTAAVFFSMTLLIDPDWLVQRMFRIFPLSETEISEDCLDLVPVRREVTIRGVIGFYRDGRFTPVRDGAILEAAGSGEVPVGRTSPRGEFEFVTSFATGAPASCNGAASVPEPGFRQLAIRAPGCQERRVPLTPAWVPHRIILECDRAPAGPSA